MKKFLFILTLSLLCAGMSWAQNVAKNANTGVEYATLQAAIDAADPNQTIVLLTDINVSQVISVVKNLTIDGKKHVINTTAPRGLWTDAEGVQLTLRNFNLIGSNATNRGIQVNDPNVTIIMDSCRIITQQYAIFTLEYDLGDNPNENLHMTVTNSYIQGLTALRSFAPEATFSFDKDTLHGINNYNNCDETDNNFAVIMMDGDFIYGDGLGSQNSNLSVTNCVIIAQTTGNCSEEWIGLADGASDVAVTVDANSKIINEEGVDKSDQINIKTGGPRNTVTMPLTAVQKDSLALFYTLTDNGDGTTTVSTAIVYYYWTTGGTYIDFHVPFEPANLVSGESIYLQEDMTMRQDVTADINGNFFLYFEEDSKTYSITQNGYHVILAEGTTCTTDQQALSLFSNPSGDVTETDNGDGTYTYAITPYVAMNVNTGMGYTSLKSAVDAVNVGDTVRILRNITLAATDTIANKTLTLDLNGDTISYSAYRPVLLVQEATLTIYDSDAGKRGTIINDKSSSYAVRTLNSTFIQNGGTLNAYYGLYLGGFTGITDASIATINDGSIIGKYGAYAKGNASLTINGGTLTGTSNHGVHVEGGVSLTINGGTIKTESSNSALYAKGSSLTNRANVVINNADISGRHKAVEVREFTNAEINDGTFSATEASTPLNYALLINGSSAAKAANVTINGGTFTTHATEDVENGYTIKNERKDTLTINGGNFMIDREGSITDCWILSTVGTSTGSVTTINGGSFVGSVEISAANTFTMTGGSITSNAKNTVYMSGNNSVFNATGGTITNTNDNEEQSFVVYANDNANVTLNLENEINLVGTSTNTWGVYAGDKTNLTMKGGNITSYYAAISGNGSNSTSTSKWLIEGGTLETTNHTAIYHPAPDSVIIGIDCDHGPTITGKSSAIEHRAGHLVIKGGTLTATGTPYAVTPNTSGTTTVGAAVAVAQHTTNVETTVDISCGTFEGESSISIANPQGNNDDNVEASITGGLFTGEVVTSDSRINDYITGGTFDDATVIGELTNRIEPGYYPFDNGDGTVTVGRYSVVYHDNTSDDLKSGVMLTHDFPDTVTITMPSTFAPVADRAVAWNTKSDGTGDWYTEGETVEINNYLDLYAHWVAVYNATKDIYYTTLQGAIDAATANDSLVVLADMTVNAAVVVNKSIIINGQKHTIDATNAVIGGKKIALVIDEINLDVKIRNLNIDGGNTCQRGVQVSGSGWADNCTVVMDSCRIYNFTYYAITAWGNSNGTSFNVSNSYIQGWTALSCYGGNSTFNFYNDTLHGINRQSGGNNDLNVITLNGQSTSTQYGIQQANKVDIQKCVIIAEELYTNKEFWLGLSYGAKNDTVTVDCETRIVDGTGSEAQNVAGKIYMYEEWEYDEVITGNVITVALTSEQKEALSAIYTLNDVTGDCDRTRISLATKYTKNNGANTMYVDFNYPFNNGLAANDKIELLEDVNMKQDVTANINGDFKLNFKEGSVTHSITNNGHHIILAESATCTTDQQALSLFSSPSGYVTETDNGDGTYTYGYANVYNVDKSKGYYGLQTAIDAADAGDSLLVLTDMTIGAITGKSTSVEIVKSLTINGLKHTITSTASRGLWVNASNVTLTLRNFYLTCTNTSDDTRGVQINSGDNSEKWINNTLLMDSCRVITVTGKTLNFVGDQGSGPVSVTVTNSYIKGWAAMQCFASNSTFTFDNDTLYGINTKSYDFGTIVIDGNSDTTKYGKNNNINITQSVIIAEKQSSSLQHVFRLQNRATRNNIVVDCQTKILNGAGDGAQDVREELYINQANCPYNSITLPLTDEQKAIIASDAVNRRFGLTDTGDEVCGTMRITKVSRQARNGRCAQDIGFHLYFDTENYANHVIAGGSAKLTLIEDVILQKDETVDVNGKFLLFFKDWYNSNITHNIINNGHHIILAEGTSCATDVEVPDSIFAVPSGFDGKIVHKSVSGQVHKFEYYAAPYVAINVNRDIKYTSLQTATDSVNTGDTVRLLRNITYTTTSDRVIITDKNLTLDLYGDTISTSFSGTIAGQYAAIQLKSGYLEVKDTKGEGVIRATNRGSAVLLGTSTSAGGDASFTLNSGKLEGAAASNTWGLYVVLNARDSVVINGGEVAATGAGPALYNKQGKVIVNDGRIQGNGKAVYNYYAYNNTYFPTTILNGGEIHGGNNNPCVDNNGGTFIMNGGTITIAGTTGISSGTSYGRNGELYINGGVISDEGLTTNTINTIAGSKGKITITGGTFNLSNDDANVININGQDTVTVTGGTFAATGTNDIIFKGAGNGAVFTINDATPNAAAMFNIGSGDSCVVNGGTFTATDNMFTNAGKLTLNGGVFTQSSDNAITNTGVFTVNDGWYSESLTRLTRGTPRWLNGDDISYYGTPELHLIKVANDAVAAAGLTGNYWQLGNTITYDANGGTGSESQDKPMNETVNLSDGTGFSYEGHTLYRWNTADDGNGDNYALGAEYSNNVDLKLYAVWRLNLDMEMDSTDVVCYGENNGTDTVRIIGGEAPFQLVLSSTVLAANDTVKNLMDRTYIYNNLKPGKYTVQLTDVLTKDTIKGTFTIAQPDTLIVESLTVPVKPCPLMGSGSYNVSVTTTGGNGGNHFVWGEAAVDVDAMESTVIPGADDRDSTYIVAVKVTDKKGCVATDTTTFSVSPVIADDGTVHSNSKLTIDTIKQGIISGCDTVLREFGTPHFTFTHPEINEGILDTIYNDIPTSYPDSVFPVGENVVIWTAVDTCGHMITGEQIIIIYHYPCPDVEMDGYTYHSVRLACDCWTDENLKTTKYSDGRAVDNIMKYQSPTHPDADANASVYGYLYDWSAALDAEGGVTVDAEGNVQGICPTGWHLPSDIEFMRVAGNGGEYDMSELRYHGYWLDGGGNNSTDFSLLPGGCYNDNTARYENLLGNAYLWSVNTADPSQPKMFWADCYCYMWQVDQTRPNMGCSVRCVKD